MRHRKNESNPLGFLKFLDDIGSEVRDIEPDHPYTLVGHFYSKPNALHEALVREDKEQVVEELADTLLCILNLANSYTGEFGSVVASKMHEKRKLKE